MKKACQLLLSCMMLSTFLSLPGFAKEMNAEALEASAFFSQIMHQTSNPLIASLAQESLLKLQGKPTYSRPTKKQVEVALIPKSNNTLAVPVLVNNQTMATFVVDTGATYTVITPALARQLNLHVSANTPTIAIVTANGTINAPFITVPSMAIGGMEVQNVQVIVQDLGQGDRLSGLLGMNFFKNMDITITPNRLILGLNPPD